MEIPKPKIRNIVATIEIPNMPNNFLEYVIKNLDINYDFDIDARRIKLKTSYGTVFAHKPKKEKDGSRTAKILILGIKSETQLQQTYNELTEFLRGFK